MNRTRLFTSLVFCAAVALCVGAPVQAQDLTLTGPSEFMSPSTDYVTDFGPGDMAEADVEVQGTSLDYTGVLLNVGAAAANNLFIKVQNQDGDLMFEYGACYLGNNGGGSFGLGFFPLDEPFQRAHMQVIRDGSDVTINFTNVDGGTKADQCYVCTGAPAPEGTGIGVMGYGPYGHAAIDNFSNGTGILDAFSYTGPLAGSGNWADIDPGMVADGSVARAEAGTARSVWQGGAPAPVALDIKANGSDGPITVSPSTEVAITIRLDPGDQQGVNAEWWIVVQWPFGMFWNYFSYVYPTGWLSGVNRCIAMPLTTLNSTKVLNATLPAGAFEFFFVLDDQVDGIPQGKWVDSVKVNVQ